LGEGAYISARVFFTPLIVAAFSLLIFGSAFAAGYEELMASGKEALEARDYKAAEVVFRSALEIEPDSHEANLYLGMTLSRIGTMQGLKEAERLLKMALRLDPDDPMTNLELGRLYEKTGVPLEALDFFESVSELVPGTGLSKEAQEHMDSIYKKAKGKPWTVALSMGTQFDSNVVVKSEDGPLPEGISDKSDWRAVTIISAGYDLHKSDRAKINAGYSLYQSLHDDLNLYNVQAHSTQLGLMSRFRKTIMVSLPFSYTYSYLYRDDFSESYSLAPSFLLAEGKGFFTQLGYKFTDNDFKDSERFGTNSDRTGHVSTLSVTQFVPIRSPLNARLGYSYSRSSTREPFQSYSGNQFFAHLTAKLPLKLTAGLYGEYLRKNYSREKFPDEDKFRKDSTGTYSASLSRELLSWLNMELSLSYVRNDSVLESYDYERTITSVLLKARY
jgi:hypothetical protein